MKAVGTRIRKVVQFRSGSFELRTYWHDVYRKLDASVVTIDESYLLVRVHRAPHLLRYRALEVQ